MRNNNIIIVKCFISSFAGEHIHQSSRGGREGGRGTQGTWCERKGCMAGSVVVTAFI